MYWLPIDWAAMSSALTSGRPPPSSVASVRAICEVANFRATSPSIGSSGAAWSKRAFCPGCRTQHDEADDGGDERRRRSAGTVPRTKSETPTMIRVTSGSSASNVA